MELLTMIIEAVAGILASVLGAFVAAGYLSRVFEKNLSPLFHTYSDEKYDAYRLMRSAKQNIYVVASIGDRFLEKYEKRIEKCLDRGVTFHILLLKKERYYDFEEYIDTSTGRDTNKYDNVRATSFKILYRLVQSYPGKINIRLFYSFLTASYIGIDIEEHNTAPKWSPHAVIQVMLYQYRVSAKDSPITCFSAKNHQNLFERTANSILEMWNDGTDITSLVEHNINVTA